MSLPALFRLFQVYHTTKNLSCELVFMLYAVDSTVYSLDFVILVKGQQYKLSRNTCSGRVLSPPVASYFKVVLTAGATHELHWWTGNHEPKPSGIFISNIRKLITGARS